MTKQTIIRLTQSIASPNQILKNGGYVLLVLPLLIAFEP